MKAELVPDNGDPPIPITRDLTVVGRRDYCDIVIDDPSLSKRHCVLVKTDGLLVIRDLGTTNGTKVKGQRIRWAALLPDDRISLGSYKVRIYLGPDDTMSPSEQYRSKWRGGDQGKDRALDRSVGGVPGGPRKSSAPSVPGVLPPSAGFPQPSMEEIDSSQFFDESELEPPSHLPRLPQFDDDSRLQFEIVDEDEDEEIFDLE
jgi:pSer/pThr/pTyr-binding forkhead associated (FHA) protein